MARPLYICGFGPRYEALLLLLVAFVHLASCGKVRRNPESEASGAGASAAGASAAGASGAGAFCGETVLGIGGAIPEVELTAPPCPKETVEGAVWNPFAVEDPLVRSAASGPEGTFLQVEAQNDGACALRIDGEVVCWGRDSAADNTRRVGPFVALAEHGGCALDNDGIPTCWRTNTHRWTDGPFTQLSVGPSTVTYNCGVLNDGNVACSAGGLDPLEPFNGRFAQVSSGHRTVCAITRGGRLVCYSHRYYSEEDLADDDDPTNLGPCTPHFPEGSFTQVSVDFDACAVSEAGSVVCWDFKGRAATHPECGFVQVSHGSSHSCGVLNDGSVRCWGHNHYGESTPPDESFEQVTVGNGFSCGLLSDGGIRCWGLSLDPPP